MPQRQNKIDVGTIGAAPCQIALNDILIKLGNSKITNEVMFRYNYLREGLKHLQSIPNVGFRKNMMRLFYDNIRNGLKKDIPKDAYTHALCCYAVLYREALRKC